MQISLIGLGAWAIGGGGWQFGWGNQGDSDSIGAIHRALELGVNWIDTAAVYGLGHSEEIVASALCEWPAKAPYIFTKCGMVWDSDGKISYSLKKESIRKECEDSLRRLRVETIDLYQMHWPADDIHETREGWTEMEKLRTEGKVRWIGASNLTLEELRLLEEIAPVTSLQPPYSLIRRDVEAEILPYCAQRNIGVIVYSPMASGLLTGAMTRERIEALPAEDWRSRNPEFTEPKLSRNLQLAERLKTIGVRHGKSAAEMAVAWTLSRKGVTGAIVGARSSQQVEGTIGAAGIEFDANDLRELEVLF